MDDVKVELAHQRIFKCMGMPFCCLDADKNFAVLKRQHVSRSCLPEKLPMQPRHPPIGDQPHENVSQPRQFRAFLAPDPDAKARRALRKLLKSAGVHRYNSLKIAHVDAGDCAFSHLAI
jgi:hypothetical protein